MDHVDKGFLRFADIVGSCLRNMAYMELFLLFVWLSRARDKHLSGGVDCGGVTWRMHVILAKQDKRSCSGQLYS
jgi:hypothetical protein